MPFTQPRIRSILPEELNLSYVGRAPSATPATGVSSVHKKEVAKLYNDAFSFE